MRVVTRCPPLDLLTVAENVTQQLKINREVLPLGPKAIYNVSVMAKPIWADIPMHVYDVASGIIHCRPKEQPVSRLEQLCHDGV